MNCPKCGAPLPDGAKFCGSCGSRLAEPSQTIVARKPTMPVVQAPEEVAVQPDNGAAAAKKSKLPLLIAIIAAVVVVLGVVFFVLPNLGGSGKDAYIALRDGKYELLPNLNKTDTVEIASVKTDEDDYSSLNAAFSPDGKYFYYMSKMDGSYGTLNRAEYGKLKDGSDKNDKYITAIATNVDPYFSVLENGVVYENADSKLYYYNGEQPTTLAKNVYSYSVDAEKNRVMYYVQDDDGDYTLYFVDLKKPDEATKLVGGVSSTVSTRNLDHILYTKEDDGKRVMYSVDTAGNTEKLTDDEKTVYYGTDALYYLGATGETYSSASLLSDADSYSKEPDADDFSIPYYYYYYFNDYNSEGYCDSIVATCSRDVVFFGEYESIETMQGSSDPAVALACQAFVSKYSSQEDADGCFPLTDAVKADLNTIAQAYGEYGDTAWHELALGRDNGGTQTDYDAYYDALSRYEAVQSLQEETDLYNLYSFTYSDGKTNLIAENVLTAVNYQNTILYFGPDAMTGTTTVDELMNNEDGNWMYDLMEPSAVHLYNADTAKTVSLSQSSFETVMDADDIAMAGDYVLCEDIGESTLRAAKVSSNAVGSFDIVSDDASLCDVLDGVLYYAANQYDNNGVTYTDLYAYANGSSSRVAQDIVANRATLYEDGQFLVRTGYKNYNDCEIALIAKDGTRTIIADGVSWVRRLDKNTVLYISDNDLYRYDGKEKTRLLTDVDTMWCRNTLSGNTISLGWFGY